MDEATAIAVILFIIIFPIVMTPVIMLAGGYSDKLRNALTLGTSTVIFLLTILLYPVVMNGEVIQLPLFEILPDLEISLRLDILSFSLSAIASFIWLLCTIFSLDYMAEEHGGNRYYTVLIFTLGSCLGIFLAGDFFTLFIFFELMSLISYILVVHEETEQALKAGYKYLVMTIISGLALFLGILITFELGGTVSLGVGTIINEVTFLSFLAFICFIAGFGLKAGMFPLHVWLPDAHPVAPSPASALLSGIMLKTGAYGLFRVIFHAFSVEIMQVNNWDIVLGVLAVITIMLGSAVALTQNDIKRRLAYSSVGQMGYILLGLSILNENAITGAMFHIFCHAIMKSCLFLAAGAIIWKTGKRLVSDMGGIGRKMPYTMGCFSIVALAMIGIPPLNGFLSKWMLGLGALDANITVYALILLISSFLNALYYLPIIVSAFFEVSGEGEGIHAHGHGHALKFNVQDVTPGMLVPMVILAISTLLFGLSPINIQFELSQITSWFFLESGIF
ncbi:MAG: monovalent cation/H+ antiporter subunit D family protein [Bacillota bacterium]